VFGFVIKKIIQNFVTAGVDLVCLNEFLLAIRAAPHNRT
jgi:hypothetical protein